MTTVLIETSIATERRAEISKTLTRISAATFPRVSREGLAVAKGEMLALAARADLFDARDFPVPESGRVDRTFLVGHDPTSGLALYVNSSLPGQTSRPHDHGGAFAIVAAVQGSERHHLYEIQDGRLTQVSEIVVEPGNPVVMAPEDIHSIRADSNEPLLHLHLYGRRFEEQGERREFDPDTGVVRTYRMTDYGDILDRR